MRLKALSEWRHFIGNIKRVIHWIPLIWRDRDWQADYLYRIMWTKTDSMVRFFEHAAFSTGAEYIAEEIKEVRDALARLIEDGYWVEACRTSLNEHVDDKGNITGDLGEIQEVIELEEQLREKDLKIVFSDAVSQRIEEWWD